MTALLHSVGNYFFGNNPAAERTAAISSEQTAKP